MTVWLVFDSSETLIAIFQCKAAVEAFTSRNPMVVKIEEWPVLAMAEVP